MRPSPGAATYPPAPLWLLWLRVDRVLGEMGIPGDTRAGRKHFGQERRESAEQRALRLIADALKDLRLTQAQFESLPPHSRSKLALAQRLRRETTMSLKWVAQQLGFASWTLLVQPARPRLQPLAS